MDFAASVGARSLDGFEGEEDMIRNRSRWLCALVAGFVLVPVSAFAEGLIPWPWLESGRYRAWKQERDSQKASWYAERSNDPVGARRYYYKGKDWPPYPRPQGAPQVPTHIYHASHYWPHPYSCADVQFVRDFTQAQEDAGWVSETTLYDYHFESEQQQLNRAGLIHLRWILESAPSNRRTVFVQATANSTASQTRLEHVQGEVVEIVASHNPPAVMLRITRPLGRSALEVYKIQVGEVNSLPIPRITSPLGGGGGVPK